MRLKVMSGRGDHEATCEADVAEMIFNKMTGKTIEALPETVKTKIPDTWFELEGLFSEGKMSYMPVNKNLDLMPTFNPTEEEVVFVAPYTGG